jgi:hypothetical protein
MYTKPKYGDIFLQRRHLMIIYIVVLW